MNASQRFPAFIVYLFPVIGWIYVLIFQRDNPLAMFHLRQSIGLFLFLIAMFLGWAAITWIISWIPFMFIFGVALFTLVIAAFMVGLIVWLMGIVNALQGRMVLLPFFGQIANRLSI